MKKAKTVTQAWITPAQIQEASLKLFGEKWREGFQDFFDMSYSQLHRYMAVYNGQTVPKAVALALDMALTLKANDLELPTLKDWITPIADVKPLLFVPEKKPKVPRPDNDAPAIDLFGDADTEPAAETEEQTETTEEPLAPPTTEPEAKPARNRRASAPKAKPADNPTKAKPAAPAKAKAKPATAAAKKPTKSKAK